MNEKISYDQRPLRLVFMGTPTFAVPSLEACARVADVTLVVTRPDAVRGRGKALVPSDVKACAESLELPCYEGSRVDDAMMDALRAAQPDIVVVAAYGAILPDRLLELPELGCINVHASSLPRWRGAAPIQRAILEGDERAGVSIMEVVHDLDAGAYCRQASLPVADTPCAELMDALARLGADELVAALGQIADGTVAWTPQDEALVTYAAKLTKAEMALDPQDGALANARRVQASADAAPARCSVGGRGVRVLVARVAPADSLAQAPEPGTYLRLKGRVLLGCADGVLEPLRVKPDGKREMDVVAWAAGLQQKSGTWGVA